MMRRGMTLVEILVVVLVLPFAMIAFDVLFCSILSDIPRSTRLVQENTTLLNMLEQMHKDISAAKSLPQSYGQDTAGEGLLLIELADGVVGYQLSSGKMLRRRLTSPQKEQATDVRIWSLPNSQVQWRTWRQDGRGYAVEVRTSIRYKLRSKYQQRMANSHLYFLGTI
jgi:prepilin-type N-terminal cleavage/methylation domain-containing protein